MKPKLTVVTPCSRPQNLARLAESLREAESHFDLQWLVVHDCRSSMCDIPPPAPTFGKWSWTIMHAASGPGQVAGHAQVNHALDRINEGLVWRLDDDNLPVPGFFKALNEAEQDFPNVDVFLFGQHAIGRYDEARWPTGVAPPTPLTGVMDSAQFVFRREALGGLRFQPDDYKADGAFIEALVAKVEPDKVIAFLAPLTQYNALARKGKEMQHFYKTIDGFFHCEPLYKRVVE